MNHTTIYVGDAFRLVSRLPSAAYQCIITSPPYWNQREYDGKGGLGNERHWSLYVEDLGVLFDEMSAALKPDGVFWLNVGDKRDKDGSLIGLPWRLALALKHRGWVLRQEVIWSKKNCMPESVKNRPSTTHEHVFMFTRRGEYYYDANAIAEMAVSPVTTNAPKDYRPNRNYPGHPSRGVTNLTTGATRNARSVWDLPSSGYRGDHPATMPIDLVDRCLRSSTKPGDHVFDPFLGAGTTAVIANRMGRDCTGIEISHVYADEAAERVRGDAPLVNRVEVLDGTSLIV